jgi:NAD dependent epimerase/dehydratase
VTEQPAAEAPPKWRGGRALVTGAAGFIGSHLVEHLLFAGADVRAFVRYNSHNNYGSLEELAPALADEVEIFRGDLVNPEAVAAAVDGCTHVFHLGALIPIPYSYIHPREYVETNVVGALNVLEACRRGGVERLVHTSTSEVYGTPQVIPITEEHRLHPQSPYAASKVGADQLVLSYFASFGLPAVLSRPFNTYGPRQTARAIIPTVIAQALTADRVEIGATEPTRDFMFVRDTAAGLAACGQADGIEGETINLGTGTEISIGALMTKILEAIGRELPVVSSVEERVRPRLSEVARLSADWSKARRLLGWAPETELDTGLEATIEWMRSALDRYKPSLYNI